MTTLNKVNIEKHLCCFNCKILPDANKIYECDECGVPYCEKCTNNNKLKCSLCKSTEFTISKFGELFINNIPVKCPYCNIEITKSKINTHKIKDCENAKYKCKIKNCQIELSKKELSIHLINKHGNELIKYLENNAVLPEMHSLVKYNYDSLLDISELSNFPNEYSNIKFANGSYTYTHEYTGFLTTTLNNVLSGYFSIKVLISKCTSPGHLSLGFSSKHMKESKGYLGGNFGKDNWGIAGNGALGEEGVWKKGCTFKSGDIVELIYNNGTISYNINKEQNSYSYKMSSNPTYIFFAITVYHKGVVLVIL